jgi:hypothetical protein
MLEIMSGVNAESDERFGRRDPIDLSNLIGDECRQVFVVFRANDYGEVISPCNGVHLADAIEVDQLLSHRIDRPASSIYENDSIYHIRSYCVR